MSNAAMWSQVAFVAVGTLSGFALGLAYFKLLRRSVVRLGSNAPGLGVTLAGSAFRISAVVGLFMALMSWSPVAAVAGLVGFAVTRQLMLAVARNS
ncbi:MAG: ATP synthase subunit I [Hyphomicrobiaceae bacterium]